MWKFQSISYDLQQKNIKKKKHNLNISNICEKSKVIQCLYVFSLLLMYFVTHVLRVRKEKMPTNSNCSQTHIPLIGRKIKKEKRTLQIQTTIKLIHKSLVFVVFVDIWCLKYMKNASMKNSTNKQRKIVRKYKKLQSFDKKK